MHTFFRSYDCTQFNLYEYKAWYDTSQGHCYEHTVFKTKYGVSHIPEVSWFGHYIREWKDFPVLLEA